MAAPVGHFTIKFNSNIFQGHYYAKCNILTITDMYNLGLGVFMYRFSIDDLPVAFKTCFSKHSDIHDYPTSHGNDLNLTNNKKLFSDHTIRTRGPILWNSLPTTIKDSKSVSLNFIVLIFFG